MLKILILNLCFLKSFYSQNTSHQTINTLNILTPVEIKCINDIVKPVNEINLINKKIAFVTGSIGSRLIDKTTFFNNYIDPWLKKNKKPVVKIIPLSEYEVNICNGTEILILVWVKHLNRKKILNIIAENNKVNQKH